MTDELFKKMQEKIDEKMLSHYLDCFVAHLNDSIYRLNSALNELQEVKKINSSKQIDNNLLNLPLIFFVLN